jgi:hypothetical protein
MANTNRVPRGGASGFNRKPGVREMKEFPVTSRELWTLGGLQAGSAAALSFAGWLAGQYVNARQSLAFAGHDVPRQVVGQWEGYSNMAFWGAVIAAALGLFLLGLSGLNVYGILHDTEHV